MEIFAPIGEMARGQKPDKTVAMAELGDREGWASGLRGRFVTNVPVGNNIGQYQAKYGKAGT
jgi:hypothetical protein